MRIRICPRCGGQILHDRIEGYYCLQCSWTPPAKDAENLMQERNAHGLAHHIIRPNAGVSAHHKALASSPWRGVRRR